MSTFKLSLPTEEQYDFITALEVDHPDIQVTLRPTTDGGLLLKPQDDATMNILTDTAALDTGLTEIRPREKTTTMVLCDYPLTYSLRAVTAHPDVRTAERCTTGQEKAPTKQVTITIVGTPPTDLDLGTWGTFSVRPFRLEPLRCFRCQTYGHHQKDCSEDPRCGVCARNHPTKVCITAHKTGKRQTTAKCANCEGAHHVWFRRCPERLKRITLTETSIRRSETPTPNETTTPEPTRPTKTTRPTTPTTPPAEQKPAPEPKKPLQLKPEESKLLEEAITMPGTQFIENIMSFVQYAQKNPNSQMDQLTTRKTITYMRLMKKRKEAAEAKEEDERPASRKDQTEDEFTEVKKKRNGRHTRQNKAET